MLRYTLFGLLLGSTALIAAGCSTTEVNNNTNTTAKTTPDDSVVMEDDYYDEIDIVTEDAYGKDLESIVRYPDSIRSYYSASDYETDVSYQTSDDQEKVREFYNDLLLADGWETSEEATDYMEFVRGDEDNPEIFTLYLTPYEGQNILEYELVYEPSLTDAQLEELELEDSEDFDIEL